MEATPTSATLQPGQAQSPPPPSTPPLPEKKEKKKRQRRALNCNPCRAKKLKCSRTKPCENCEKRGDHDICIYQERLPDSTAQRQQLSQSPLREDDVALRLQNFHNEFLRLSTGNPHSAESLGTSYANSHGNFVRFVNDTLAEMERIMYNHFNEAPQQDYESEEESEAPATEDGRERGPITKGTGRQHTVIGLQTQYNDAAQQGESKTGTTEGLNQPMQALSVVERNQRTQTTVPQGQTLDLHYPEFYPVPAGAPWNFGDDMDFSGEAVESRGTDMYHPNQSAWIPTDSEEQASFQLPSHRHSISGPPLEKHHSFSESTQPVRPEPLPRSRTGDYSKNYNRPILPAESSSSAQTSAQRPSQHSQSTSPHPYPYGTSFGSQSTPFLPPNSQAPAIQQAVPQYSAPYTNPRHMQMQRRPGSDEGDGQSYPRKSARKE